MDFELWIIGKMIALYSVLLFWEFKSWVSIFIIFHIYRYSVMKKKCQIVFTFYQPW